jgi:hypothetical protein
VNNEHEIYRNYYEMGGPPPGAEETGKRYLEGTFLNGNLIALYSERNYWLHLTKPTRGLTEEEHQQVSALIEAKKPIPDWVSMRTSDHGTKRFFTNLLIYAITRGNIADYSNYAP